MSQKKIDVNISSEIGELEAVIIHTPGSEVENMTPQNAERALYSDILSLADATKEYDHFKSILSLHAETLEVKDLLTEILKNDQAKEDLLSKVCKNEKLFSRKNELAALPPSELSVRLIEGVELPKNTLTNYLSNERFLLSPLHNFFFTRDAAAVINNEVMISRMANAVREREAIIMEAVFNYHPRLKTKTNNAVHEIDFNPKITMEGGDVIIARNDTLLIGNSGRTSLQGIDYILEKVKNKNEVKHIIVQELPYKPESFIHLDMAFTFLSQNEVMIYEPMIMNPNQFKTILISIDNGNVKIDERRNIPEALSELKFNITPIPCGGKSDPWIQEREQWHSGANFFAMGPAKLISYGRNTHTLEEMNKHGYEIISSEDVLNKKKSLSDYKKYVVTIPGSELSRGGGGCRCMTMPVKRKPVN